MKKRLFTIVAALVAIVGVLTSCDKESEVAIAFESLPSAAQATINDYFDKDLIILVTYEKEFLNHEYAVIFSDGTAIEFEKSGAWESIESQITGVPLGVLPTKIAEFVTSTYPDRKVTEVSKETFGYEVDIDDMIGLEFDLSGNLTGYDM